MKKIAYLVALILCVSCGADGIDSSGSFGGMTGSSSAAEITNQSLDSYINLFNQLKEASPEVLELINEGEPVIDREAELAQIQQIIRDNGMTYDDFVATNARIGVIYSLATTDRALFEDIKNQQQQGFDNSAAEFEKMLADPDIPEEAKENIRQSIQQLKSGGQQMAGTWDQLDGKLEERLQQVKDKLNKMASQAEIGAILKNRDALESAYDGISRPSKMSTERF